MGGTAGQIGLGFLGADLPADIRDLAYDLEHRDSIPKKQLALDAFALLPVVGGLKYADDAIALAKYGDEALAAAKAAKQASMTTEPLSDAINAQRKAELMDAIKEQIRKADATPTPRQVLDPDWYKQYNEVRAKFDAAAKKAADANGGEYVTYYRVQTPGKNGSFERVFINNDNTISIQTSKKNLSVSAYTTEHAEHYASTGKRAGNSYVISFDVPVWFDELIRENAILQTGSRTNPLNKGGTAPKMVDTTTAGYTYELPSFWNEWLEKYATNARITDIGALP